MTALTRVDELERSFGDPFAARASLGFEAILAADEQDAMFADGERALDDFGLNAEFVPPEFGGRMSRLDDFVEVMRSVYRRDPCLGLGYGMSSFIAGVNVWTSADGPQRRRVAEHLLSGRKLACAYHELAHGNDMARTEFAALPAGGRLLLNGRKEVVTNIERAEALIMFARTDERPGSRSHSQVFVPKDEIPAGTMRYLPRFPSAGMRGVQLGGIEFDDCPVPEDNIIGFAGQGLETAMRSFQITRTVLPAMTTGVLDSGIRIALRQLSSRSLYGARATELPVLRSILAEAFVDQLVCESFGLVATRALHLLPAETSVIAAAAKFSISKRLMEAMHRVSIALGAQSYLRDGESAAFQKLLRDLQPVGFGHAARSACQMTILPQLPLLARRSWFSAEPGPAELFALDADLPPIPFDRLAVTGGGADHLSSCLVAGVESVPDGPVRDLGRVFVDRLAALADRCRSLPPEERTFTASAEAYELTARYADILAAASCFEVWRHNQADDFLGDPAWLIAALTRLAHPKAVLPADLTDRLFDVLSRRHDHRLAFGLRRRQYA